MKWFNTIKIDDVANMTPEQYEAELSRIQGGTLGQQVECPSCGHKDTRSSMKKRGQTIVTTNKCRGCGHTWTRQV